VGRFIEKNDKPWLWSGGGIGAGLAIGFALAHIRTLREWPLDVIAQPVATLLTGAAAIVAAGIALHNGQKTREQDKEIYEANSRAEQERTLRERFTSIVELLATEDLTKRESGVYAMAALADDWAAFYEDDQESALREQQVCLNILTGQLRDPILEESPPELYTFKERIQDTIFTRFEEEGGKNLGQWSDLSLTLENCHFYKLSSKGVFKRRISFANSYFHEETRFVGSHFCDDTLFSGAHFYGYTNFSGTHFNTETPFDPKYHYGNRKYADFSGVNFHESTSFERVKFHNEAVFDETHFNSSTTPHADIGFLEGTTFNQAHFCGTTSFSHAHFHVLASFTQANFDKFTWFSDAHFEDPAFFEGANFYAKTSFNNTQFKDETSFEGARFVTTADFSNTKFKFPESHESNKIIKSLNTNLDNAKFSAEFPAG
jgi:hypothetical protein